MLPGVQCQGRLVMLDHVSIGVSDIDAAKRFYDATLQPLGYRCLMPSDSALGYGGESAMFWLLAANSPVPANANSGLHFCFVAPTRKSVEDFHKSALAAGGRDNGAPGLRDEYGPNYFAAFVTDPWGYRIRSLLQQGGVAKRARLFDVRAILGSSLEGARHCEERSDEAIHASACILGWIASLRSQ